MVCDATMWLSTKEIVGLNPCFNGIWSATLTIGDMPMLTMKKCLNPCFNGIWSATFKDNTLQESDRQVLILVLMEYGLRPGHFRIIAQEGYVLILVLMEYGLRPKKFKTVTGNRAVLILVLMEYGLRHKANNLISQTLSLNPCFNGIWSATREINLSKSE